MACSITALKSESTQLMRSDINISKVNHVIKNFEVLEERFLEYYDNNLLRFQFKLMAY